MLESYEVGCSESKRKHEQYWIDKLKPNLNSYRAFNSVELKQEIIQKYRDDHKEHLKAEQKTSKTNYKNKTAIQKKIDALEAELQGNISELSAINVITASQTHSQHKNKI